MIYVDTAVYPFRGQLWCHLTADTLGELYSDAALLGLHPDWFQCPPKASWPHYDLAPTRRVHALKLGALEIGPCELLYRAAIINLEWHRQFRSRHIIAACERAEDRYLKLFIDSAFALNAH